MKINFNVTGTERKKLVAAVTEILNTQQKYLGAPTFAFEIGNYTIDKTGALLGEGSVSDVGNSDLLKALNERGYIGEVADSGGDVPSEVQTADAINEADTLAIELPLEGFSETALDNLEKLVTSKAALIKKAIGTDNLPVEKTEDTLRFPWFSSDLEGYEVNAYTKFIAALCDMAKNQKRIIAKEKPVDNEKYAFRCFLLRLGFIGEDYKAERKILLANLSGNGSFKSGERKPTLVSDTGDLTETLADAELIHAVNASFEEGSDE